MIIQNNITKKKRRSVVSKLIRSTDLFGANVQLNYKKKSNYQSLLGGFITLLFSIGMFIFFIIQVAAVLSHSNYTITNSLKKINLSDDKTEISLDINNFDFAYQIQYQGNDPDYYNQTNLDRLFEVKVSQMHYSWNKTSLTSPFAITYDPIPQVQCDETRLGGDLKHIPKEFLQKYSCPAKNYTLKLQGTFTSDKAKMLYIQFRYCTDSFIKEKYPNSNMTCLNKTEINKIIGYFQINLPFTGQYFDQEEFDEAKVIKTAAMPYFFTMHPQIYNRYNIQVSKNYAILKDSMISNYFDVKNHSYIDTKIQYNSLNSQNFDQILEFFIITDENIHTTERQISTLSDALSAVGGLAGFIMPLISVLLSKIQESLYESSLLKKIFYVSNQQKNSQIDMKTMPQSVTDLPIIEKKNEKKPKVVVDTQRENEEIQEINDWSEISINNHQSNKSMMVLTNKQEETNHVERIFQQINQITHFKLTLSETIKFMFKRFFKIFICCLPYLKNPSQKEFLYKKGKKQLEQHLDIVEVVNSLRKVDILSNILLSTYQQQLIPIFKDNLLDELKGKNRKQFLTDEQLKSNLERLLSNMKNNRINKKIFKCIKQEDLSLKTFYKEDDQANNDFQQLNSQGTQHMSKPNKIHAMDDDNI